MFCQTLPNDHELRLAQQLAVGRQLGPAKPQAAEPT
jgi:hypothetical protein